MSGSGLEAGDADLAKMVGASRSRYPRDNSGACASGDGGRDGEGGVKYLGHILSSTDDDWPDVERNL